MRTLRSVALTLLASILVVLAVTSSASAMTWGFSENANAFTWPSIVSQGASVIRSDVSFDGVEHTQGTWDWTGPDWKASLAQQNGGQWLPILDYNVGWNSPDGNPMTPPATDLQRLYFAQFAQSFAQRYQGRVAAYEIWNEPNNPTFWGGSPNAVNYAKLFDAAYEAIRGVDPTTPIIMGGVNDRTGWQSFTTSFYNASADDGYAVNLHPYNSPAAATDWARNTYPGRRVAVTEYGVQDSVQRDFLMTQAHNVIAHDDALRAAARGDGRNTWDIGYSWDDPAFALSSNGTISSAGSHWLHGG